eukprot:TRINITY_DN4977_c0_g1_i10.p1 TRINITY_DN4977_c0_g1~~TRINITY_DN4977_c0_g1_i10.p1  ORF type:complete len:362 (+),score=119.86 TRINITY_DN4977_c0_g1_i10:697-1782(+)
MESSSDRKQLLVIYTGGTLGMKKVGDSYRPVPKFLGEVMESMQELKDPKMPTYTLLEWDELKDSSDMGPDDWVMMAAQIEKNYWNYDGFLILHGTDTMAYTASALSFMFENLGKTIVLTGSVTPLVEVYSDARRNLVVSMIMAANVYIPEVTIFFNNALLRGNRSQKADAWGLGAFSTGYFPPLATLGGNIKIHKVKPLHPPRGRLRVHKKLCPNVAVLRLVPGFSDEIVHNLLQPPLQGLVLQTYGVGNAPSRKQAFLQCLKEATDRGVVVVVVSQCQSGTVDFKQYQTGEALGRLGVVGGFDMTAEAASAKLAVLLGAGLPIEEVKSLMATELRGEFSRPDEIGGFATKDQFRIQYSSL